MLHHNLRLAHLLDVAGVLRVMDALCAVPGVEGVGLTSGERFVEVRYDQRRTNPRALMSVLAHAGCDDAAPASDGF